MHAVPARPRHARPARRARRRISFGTRRGAVGVVTAALILLPTGAVASSWHHDSEHDNSEHDNSEHNGHDGHDDAPMVIDGGNKGRIYIDPKLDIPLTPSAQHTVGPDRCVAACTTQQQVNVVVVSGGIHLDGVAPVYVSGGATRTGSFTVHVRDLRGQDSGWKLQIRYRGLLDSLTGQPFKGGKLMVTPTCTKTAGPLTLTTAPGSNAAVGDKATLCNVPIASSGSLAGGLVDVTVGLRVDGVIPGCKYDDPDGETDGDCDDDDYDSGHGDCHQYSARHSDSKSRDWKRSGVKTTEKKKDEQKKHDKKKHDKKKKKDCKKKKHGNPPSDSHVALVLLDYYLVKI